MQNPTTYTTLRAMDTAKARQIVIKFYLDNKCNVSKTARYFGMKRDTVRNIREKVSRQGYLNLHDLSRKPHTFPNKTPEHIESLVIEERLKTNYGRKRLALRMKSEHDIDIPEDTIRHILKRNNLKKQKKRRSKNGKSKPLYDFDKLYPLSTFQVDTKHILDKKALPPDVYAHLKYSNLPKFQWTAIDPLTKIRFLAYSYKLCSYYGLLFMTFIALWLRAFGIQTHILFQTDSGVADFAGPYAGKIKAWNQYLAKFGSSLKVLTYCHAYQQGFVERSHRIDDEEFYVPCLKKMHSSNDFLAYANRFALFYNANRGHTGLEMNGLTPLQKLNSTNLILSNQVILFPTFILDDLSFLSQKGGQYVLTHYLV